MGSMVAKNSGQEAADFYVKRDFGGGKGAALEIRQVWWGRGIQGSSGVGVQYRDIWDSVYWDGYR